MKTTKRSKVATKFSKRTLAIVVVIGVAIVILLTIIITDQNRKFSMERQIETGFGLYVVDTSKLHVFNEFKNALKSGHLQYVKSQINEMINSLLRTEEIKCQHLLFSERDETAGTDAVNILEICS